MNNDIKNIRNGFKKGFVEMLVLHLLSQKEMYGYELSQIIKETSNDILIIPEGSLYPALYKLEDKGYVKEDRRLIGKRRQRSYYIIQPAGVERLQMLLSEYRNVQNGLEAVLQFTGGEETKDEDQELL